VYKKKISSFYSFSLAYPKKTNEQNPANYAYQFLPKLDKSFFFLLSFSLPSLPPLPRLPLLPLPSLQPIRILDLFN